jgi:hypothetical protein
MYKHVVMFSGGIGSWMAAKRVAEQHGTDNMVLLFSDVKGGSTNPHIGEDEDTYRFVREAAENVGAPLVTVMDGRNIWEVFRDKRMLGNSRIANCSHILKQRPARKWLDTNCDPADTTVYVGIDWTETHRIPAIQRNYLPYQAKAPLTEKPFIDKVQMIEAAEAEGLVSPRLYELGFSHNNCGGGCVRAGQGQFRLLLEKMPERYAEWESQERKMQEFLQRDVTILKKRVNGVVIPLSLKTLRETYEQSPALVDSDDLGGCGCFVQDDTNEE